MTNVLVVQRYVALCGGYFRTGFKEAVPKVRCGVILEEGETNEVIAGYEEISLTVGE